jgi:muconolactone delta-isomerase
LLYHVRMDVRPPHGTDPAEFDRLKAEGCPHSTSERWSTSRRSLLLNSWLVRQKALVQFAGLSTMQTSGELRAVRWLGS